MHSIIPLFPQACRHGAYHPGSTEPPPIGVVAAEAGGLGVAPGVRQPAVGYQVPTPCVGALGCHEEGVSQVLICGPCTGGALSVGQKPLAWTKAGGNSSIRTQYRQTNVEDSVESGGEHAREWRAACGSSMRSCCPQGACNPCLPRLHEGRSRCTTRHSCVDNDPRWSERLSPGA